MPPQTHPSQLLESQHLFWWGTGVVEEHHSTILEGEGGRERRREREGESEGERGGE